MKRSTLAPLLLVGLCLGCGGSHEAAPPATQPAATQPPSGLGADVANAAADTATLHEAEDAANAVIRAAGDCAAVSAALPRAQEALEQAGGKVRTATGRMTVDTLKTQIERVASACP